MSFGTLMVYAHRLCARLHARSNTGLAKGCVAKLPVKTKFQPSVPRCPPRSSAEQRHTQP